MRLIPIDNYEKYLKKKMFYLCTYYCLNRQLKSL